MELGKEMSCAEPGRCRAPFRFVDENNGVVGWLQKGTETIQRSLPNKPTRRLKLRCLGCVVEVLGLATKLFCRYSLQRPLRPGATEE